MNGLMSGEWFVIRSGEFAGRWHMVGWFGSAFSVNGWGPHPDKLVSYGICPRCFAMVITDDGPGKGPDQTWAHEDWHHRTDYPHPTADPDQLADLLRAAGPGGMSDDQVKTIIEQATVFTRSGREELKARKDIRKMRKMRKFRSVPPPLEAYEPPDEPPAPIVWE